MLKSFILGIVTSVLIIVGIPIIWSVSPYVEFIEVFPSVIGFLPYIWAVGLAVFIFSLLDRRSRSINNKILPIHWLFGLTIVTEFLTLLYMFIFTFPQGDGGGIPIILSVVLLTVLSQLVAIPVVMIGRKVF